MTFEEIMAEWNRKKDEYFPVGFHRGAVIGVLEKAAGSTARRHKVLEKLTGKTSSKQLTEEERFALYHLVLPFKPEGGHWSTQLGEVTLAAICETLISGFVQEPLPMESIAKTCDFLELAVIKQEDFDDEIPF